jgi:hypothetical protein
MKHKLIAALLTGGLLAGAAACTDEAKGASSAKHAKSKVTCHRITAKAHVQGTGKYLLTLKGVKQPVPVPKPAYRVAGVGDKYCTNK